MDDVTKSIVMLVAAIAERAMMDANKNYSGTPANCEATGDFHSAKDCASHFLSVVRYEYDAVEYCLEVFEYATH